MLQADPSEEGGVSRSADIFKFLLFGFLFLITHACMGVRVPTKARRKMPDLLGLELGEAVSHRTWMATQLQGLGEL